MGGRTTITLRFLAVLSLIKESFAMRHHDRGPVLRVAALALSLAVLSSPGRLPAREVAFQKTVIDELFRSEGVGVGDVNRDGKPDVIVGDLWYEAPGWSPHEIRAPRRPTRDGYTEAFAVYPGDFNRDGWVDVLVVPFHGNDAKWYENPKNKEGHWTERVAFRGTGNETRLYGDLFGDGKKVFLMGVEGQLAWVPVPDDPTGPWPVHPIIAKGENPDPADKFAHGLGFGDVNGDGRADVLTANGWYEQPPEGRSASGLWKPHKTPISADGVADMVTFDADGDGRADIFSTSAHGSGVYWHRQTGDRSEPTFQTTVLNRLIPETHSLNFVDLDGDGKKDLVTGRRFFAHGFTPERAGDPAPLGWFEVETRKGQPPVLTPHVIDDQSGIGAQFVTEDVNGDGTRDVVVSGRKGVYLFLQGAK